MKVIAVTQARIGSSRLPRKVLNTIDGKTLLEIHLRRLLCSNHIDRLVVATTTEPGSELIVNIAHDLGVAVYQGSLHDVLDRFYQSVKNEEADYVVRLTSDCPLIDPALIDRVIDQMLVAKVDYVSNTMNPTFPDGQDIEVFTKGALETAWRSAKLLSEREHVTPYIWKNSSYFQQTLFTSLNYESQRDYNMVRLTVDEQNDFDTIVKLATQLGLNAGWEEYANFYLDHVSEMVNYNIKRNEGYEKSLSAESQNNET